MSSLFPRRQSRRSKSRSRSRSRRRQPNEPLLELPDPAEAVFDPVEANPYNKRRRSIHAEDDDYVYAMMKELEATDNEYAPRNPTEPLSQLADVLKARRPTYRGSVVTLRPPDLNNGQPPWWKQTAAELQSQLSWGAEEYCLRGIRLEADVIRLDPSPVAASAGVARLELQLTSTVPETFFQGLRRHTGLRELTVICSASLMQQLVPEVAASCPYVRLLALTGQERCDDDGVKAIANALVRMRRLRVLTLQQVWSASSVSVERLAALLQSHLPHLLSLGIMGVHFDESGLALLLHACAQRDAPLRGLEFAQCCTRCKGIAGLLTDQALPVLSQLYSLKLRGVAMTQPQVNLFIGSVIPSMHRLRVLSLHQCSVHTPEQLLPALMPARNMRELQVFSGVQHVQEKQVTAVVTVAQTLRHVEACQFLMRSLSKDMIARLMTSLIPQWTQLRQLTLESWPISLATAPGWLTTLSQLLQLRRLSVPDDVAIVHVLAVCERVLPSLTLLQTLKIAPVIPAGVVTALEHAVKGSLRDLRSLRIKIAPDVDKAVVCSLIETLAHDAYLQTLFISLANPSFIWPANLLRAARHVAADSGRRSFDPVLSKLMQHPGRTAPIHQPIASLQDLAARALIDTGTWVERGSLPYGVHPYDDLRIKMQQCVMCRAWLGQSNSIAVVQQLKRPSVGLVAKMMCWRCYSSSAIYVFSDR